LSGNHALIEEWRTKQSFKRTLTRRPDLLEDFTLSKKETKWMEQVKEELNQEK
jgi:tRNA (guanine37-N1)-methyltransferase